MHSTNLGENGCFFYKGSDFCAFGGSRHLAMIVARGVALPELMERRCSVSYFEPGLVIQLSPWLSTFFVLHDSHFAVRHGYIKKSADAVAFLNVAPMRLHRENCKQLNEGDGI